MQFNFQEDIYNGALRSGDADGHLLCNRWWGWLRGLNVSWAPKVNVLIFVNKMKSTGLVTMGGYTARGQFSRTHPEVAY